MMDLDWFIKEQQRSTLACIPQCVVLAFLSVYLLFFFCSARTKSKNKVGQNLTSSQPGITCGAIQHPAMEGKNNHPSRGRV